MSVPIGKICVRCGTVMTLVFDTIGQKTWLACLSCNPPAFPISGGTKPHA